MDPELKRIIDALYKQNDVLGIARNAYLAKEAERKHFEANLINSSDNASLLASHAAKTTSAQGSQAWLEFHTRLARLEAEFKFQEFKMEILNKEYLAVHLSLKLDHETLKKG